MNEPLRLKSLRIALALSGIAMLCLYPLSIVWPSGWTWHAGYSPYLPMIIGVYATLGAFLIGAARNPLAHRSLIAFTVWSSVVHATIMTAQAFSSPEHRGHLLGDVPALFLVAIALGVLMPRGTAAT